MSSSLTQPVETETFDKEPTDLPAQHPPAELFSQDQLDRHAVALASQSKLAPEPARGVPLLPRLDEAAGELDAAYRFLTETPASESPVVGSEDWLRDNYHIVQDQIREIRQDLPRQYYFELPKLAGGADDGYPRVYVIARELTTHTAGRFDLQTLVDFAAAYQRVAPLTIGEIWAIPIMLRLALVEELRRLAADVVAARRARDRARRWGLQLGTGDRDVEAVVAEMLREESAVTLRLSAPFVVELLHWLRDQPSSAAPAWHALHRALEAQEDSPEEMLRIEHQREAADQLAIGNIITSMRLLSSIDWPLFFERVSLVERILREDPAGAYGLMDFPTRDRYRHSVEQLAKGARTPEEIVAQRAVDLARTAQQTDPTHDRTHHVGYYLISRGRFRLERAVGYDPTLRDLFARFFYGHPVLGYLGTIAGTTGLGVASFVSYAHRHGATPLEMWIVALAVLLPLSELAISLINLVVTSQVSPRQLPKLDLRGGIPASDRTMVVVPAIIDSADRLQHLLDDLEVRFFANRDDHLHFALLSDFADSTERTRPDDGPLIAAARKRVDELNARHGPDRFFLFHRERQWNDGERRWMGRERKRGKLAEFNRLLRGATDTSFVVQHGDLSILPGVRYVITLDSDTQLPREAGRRLVGTLSHPLNRPRFDADRGRVTEGYGILQPRVSVSVVSANRTVFSQVFSGHVGVDPYTTAVSDLYQDMFGEGSYVGKGIYDVDAFERSLQNRIPENTLLSHDLFEGLYARAGLCTDIDLVDDYPASYVAYSARQHRWVRGDWQIVRWLWRTVPDGNGQAVPNTLPVISRWKLFDNLRRSLIPPALLALLVAGWTMLPGSPALWTTLVLLVLAFPAYIQVARSIGSHVAGVPLIDHLRAERDNILTSLRQATFSVVVLAHQSYVMLDAIGRVLVRLLITRRRLLEWVTADRVENHVPSMWRVFRRLWQAPAIAVAVSALVAATAPDRLLLASPILILWFISPAIVHSTGRPLPHRRPALTRSQRSAFRSVARQTWRFFEDLVGAKDNWLVPDNYQENRADVVAHRTSPTNIGLQLLATLSAYDFGYLSFAGILDRLEPTFDTLLRMHRYRGHFYNWYDTTTLAPLAPAYISTVDSGNLAGYLLALRSGLAGIADTGPIIGPEALEGIEDAIGLFEIEVDKLTRGRPLAGLKKELGSLHSHLARRPATLLEWKRLLRQLEERLQAVSVLLHEIEEPLIAGAAVESPPAAWVEASVWLERAAVAVNARQRELDRLTGWMTHVPPSENRVASTDVPTLPQLTALCEDALAHLPAGAVSESARQAITRSRRYAEELIERAERLSALADDLIEETEFGFLFNTERQLFSIGFSVTDGRLDNSYYDILASEARLASFTAIATGTLSHEHWFKLGRALTEAGGSRALLSWSASMFEYLMPVLVMRTYPGTLLDETYTAVINRQIQYGHQRGVPWGISESAYNAQDLEKNYQYRAFGVPGLGLKRGLAEDLVVAPYASILAAPFVPADVLANLEHLTREGMRGRYGYCEAIDYTPERLPPDHKGGVVLTTWMAHHQGMSLLALNNLLNGSLMQARFHADPRIQAADLLLQERVPQLVPLRNPPIEKAEHVPVGRRTAAPPVRRYTTPHTLSPRAHLLSNGSYSVMVTNSGGGYSRRQQIALTRWRDDITTDAWGTFIFIRDLENGEVWSTTHLPSRREAEEYEATFALDRAVYRRLDNGLETRTELVVSPEDDAELRRVSITNHSHRARSLELTSYAEVVLAPAEADLAHPAFSNLFVETTALPEWDALLCSRRPRAGTDRLYLIHVLSGRGRVGTPMEYETDRARFIGRGRSIADPVALNATVPLSNTTGPVLDPIVSLRQSVRLPPGGTVRLAFTTGFADSEAGARRLVEKYYDRRAVARAIALASTHAQIELRHLGLSVDDTIRFQRLAGRLLFSDPRLRSSEAVLANTRGQNELWKYGISGDLPIVLATIRDSSQLPLLSDLLKAHEYLRNKGLAFDLVVLNTHLATYRQDLQDAVQQMVEAGPEQAWIDRPGGVFLRRADIIPVEDQMLLRAAARAIMDGENGGLHKQLIRPQVPLEELPGAIEARDIAAPRQPGVPPSLDLELFNGLGGFVDDGREYVVRVHQKAGLVTPAPWVNVVAHPTFGFTASDLSTGYTWSENSHENRLTPWRNDPVCDPPGEAIFLADRNSGRIWSVTPLPAGGGQQYAVRHGQGYSIYEHARDGIASRLRIFIAAAEPVKIFQATLRNLSNKRRELSVTLYVEWVLGPNRSRTSFHIVTSRDPATGALVARNAFREAFGDRLAFVDLTGGDERSITGDRTEFIGRNGTLAAPAALEREGLSGRTGATLDPCGAVQVKVTLQPGEERTLIGLVGEATSYEGVASLVRRCRAPQGMDAPLADVAAFWDNLLGTLQVRTPDRAMDLLLNRWLLYQALSCRIWGRSAFYQSGGAFGFRDQLQDVLALLFAAPHMARDHILHAASRQFVEGDVQHWWHEPGGQGVRTRFSDDRLWLVYATLHFVSATGDETILDESVPFLEARPLNPDEHEVYERPSQSRQRASLYEHCVRAIALNLSSGEHGLPLMGTGDWNDGMNLVGAEGKGESVWLGWFLLSILRPFAQVAEARGEGDRADGYRKHAEALERALNDAWDGDWYRRAYFDNGMPLGSRQNTECRIDAIAQSWAVLSGGRDRERARRAMDSADQHLVRRDDRIVLLLTPPFDTMTPSPGYIQGYVPGVRENGGQYTHAALWTVLAFARLGDGNRAYELYSMLNPLNRTRTREEIDRYRAEPYVIAADVYSEPPHAGRGGWTWYTGSASWMYRVGIEGILGLTLDRGALRVNPCIPPHWPGFQAMLRRGAAVYTIVVENPNGLAHGVAAVELDGAPVPDGLVPLADDGRGHTVRVVLGARTS